MLIDAAVVRSLRRFPVEVGRRLAALDGSESRRRPPAGPFAMVEHLCHLRDYDLLGCQARIRRILAEEAPFLEDFDGDGLARERNYLAQDAEDAFLDFARARTQSLELLEGLTEEELARPARLGSIGDITIRRLVDIVAEHDATHLKELDDLLDRLHGDADRAAIGRAVERFQEAYARGDLVGVAASYSDSLVKLRQGAPPESKDEAVRRIASTLATEAGRLEISNDEILVSGDVAVVRGSFVSTLTPKTGGPPKRLRRRFLEIWRRETGAWVVCRTMDNSGDGTPAGSGPGF